MKTPLVSSWQQVTQYPLTLSHKKLHYMFHFSHSVICVCDYIFF